MPTTIVLFASMIKRLPVELMIKASKFEIRLECNIGERLLNNTPADLAHPFYVLPILGACV